MSVRGGTRSHSVAMVFVALALAASCSGDGEQSAGPSSGSAPSRLEIDARRFEHGQCPEDVIFEHGEGPDPWVAPSSPVIAATTIESSDTPVPEDILTFAGPLTTAAVDWSRVVRRGASVSEVDDGMGRVEAIASERLVDDATYELELGSEVLVVLDDYASLDEVGIADAVALDPDGSAWFLGSCGDGRTEQVKGPAAREGLSPADYVRQRIVDPVAFDATTTVPERHRPVQIPQVDPLSPTSGGLTSIGVHVVAPPSWLTPEGPASICTLTSVGFGDCFRLSSAMAGVGDLAAYAPPGTVSDVRVVLLFDGGVPPVDLVVVDQVGFPGLGFQVALDGALGEPTATVIRN